MEILLCLMSLDCLSSCSATLKRTGGKICLDPNAPWVKKVPGFIGLRWGFTRVDFLITKLLGLGRITLRREFEQLGLSLKLVRPIYEYHASQN